MKNKILRAIVFILLPVILMFAFVGCKNKDDTDVSVSTAKSEAVSTETVIQPKNESQVDAADTETSDAGEDTEEQVTDDKKKVYIVTSEETPLWIAQREGIITELESKGYKDGKNIELKVIKSEANPKKCAEIISEIKSIQPNVVITDGNAFIPKDLIKPIENEGIPVVTGFADAFVDTQGLPLTSISGIRAMSPEAQKNAYQILNECTPLSGKKAVFITYPVVFSKEKTEEALVANGIELKEYLETKSFEEYKKFVLKYNNDSEVGWILVGAWPSGNIEGVPAEEVKIWDRENREKPSITFWESAVEKVMLVGLGTDLIYNGIQMGDMAARILNGEDVKNIIAENPAKTNIILNQQRAKDLGIEFPPNILGGAYRIYTDYKGTFVEQQ